MEKGQEMLEIGRNYPKLEMTKMLGTKSKQGIDRKLSRYGVDFSVCGTGENAVYTIKAIAEPFKIYAILDLGFDGGTDFGKLRDFYYHYFQDEIFMALPDEVKEVKMREIDRPISRQTIANYVRKLEDNHMIYRNTDNFIYYFAYKQTQRFCEHDEYVSAWKEYWDSVHSGISSFEAIWNMRIDHGGVARKQAIPDINAIGKKELDYMLSLIHHSIENEYNS